MRELKSGDEAKFNEEASNYFRAFDTKCTTNLKKTLIASGRYIADEPVAGFKLFAVKEATPVNTEEFKCKDFKDCEKDCKKELFFNDCKDTCKCIEECYEDEENDKKAEKCCDECKKDDRRLSEVEDRRLSKKSKASGAAPLDCNRSAPALLCDVPFSNFDYNKCEDDCDRDEDRCKNKCEEGDNECEDECDADTDDCMADCDCHEDCDDFCSVPEVYEQCVNDEKCKK